jgi:hypothetical protein
MAGNYTNRIQYCFPEGVQWNKNKGSAEDVPLLYKNDNLNVIIIIIIINFTSNKFIFWSFFRLETPLSKEERY